jgi:DNA helicase-2/ATP-dependent DNA helicase PcrA
MLRISDGDITRAEGLLLPAGCVFNEERRNFIKCMESRDVVACPGSGKTTALLAKLLILAPSTPFSNGSGICVLTHTNVAINEIKRRAGEAADALFVHPNYFGTIQGFVNRFLAIPAYRNMYRRPIFAIDNDIFLSALKAYYYQNYFDDLRPWLEYNGGLKTLGDYWFRPIDLAIGKDMDKDIPHLSRGTKSYNKIEVLRRKVLAQGILSYNDAYSLGLNYLQRYSCVAEAIRHRFKFVFIDEMQDTDDHQLRIIDRLFTGSNAVILQRLGDPNQAIYQSSVKRGMLWSPTGPVLPFSDSLRYGESIAKVLNTIRVDCTLTLGANPNRNSLPPYMLLFHSGSEERVIPAFGALIREHGLHELESPRFCAVGWVGKDKTEEGKVCLCHYHRGYQKTHKSNSRWFGSLLSYTRAMELYLRDNPRDAGEFTDIVLAAIIRALRLAGCNHPDTERPFTVTSFNSYLRQNNDKLFNALRLNLAGWVLAFRRGEMTAMQIRGAISTFIRCHFINGKSEKLADFLDSDAVDFAVPEKECACANTFVSDMGDVIEVGTVHSVKGETYTATLYLETFYQKKLDSERLLPFCSGHYPKGDSRKAYHCENLKIAHVAFSRPTHLLAFACCNEQVAGHETELESAGWTLRRI